MKANSLTKRCPCCGKRRKYREPPGDQGGEIHPRRPPWVLTPFGVACGWCYIKYGCKIPTSPAETLRERVRLAAKQDGLTLAGNRR